MTQEANIGEYECYPFTLSRDQAPIIFAPGTKYAYSNPEMAMLSYTVTSALRVEGRIPATRPPSYRLAITASQ